MEKIDFEGLKKYLLTLTKEDFRNETKIKSCTSQNEIVKFERAFNKKHTKSKEIIIKNGEYFLVDILGNDLSVVKDTKRNYRLPDGRVKRGKLIITMIDDCRKTYGDCINGYWAIPKEFLND